MLRLTTRLAHSRVGVSRLDIINENDLKLPENKTHFLLNQWFHQSL